MLSDFTKWLLELFTGYIDWFLELVLWLPKKIWAMALDGLAEFLESMDVPPFMQDAQSYFSGIPTGVVYFLDFFAVAEGVGMIVLALVLRFVLRRIPFIG